MSTTPTKADYYVATNGNDTNPGTIEAPFATLARARDAVRELKQERLKKLAMKNWGPGDLAVPTDWAVFGPVSRDDPEPDFAKLKDIPAELTVAGRGLAARKATFANNQLDLGALLGGKKEGKTAYLLATVTADQDMDVTLGAGADWWMKWLVNGNVVCDTLASGNGAYPPRIADHRFVAHLRTGLNLIVAKVISGSASFVVAAGGPRELRELKRAVDEQDLRQPVNVFVRGGKYYLSETLVLSAEDSGTPNSPVTWQAYPGEKPVLSGGRTLAGWVPYKDKILCAEVPEARGGWLHTRQLFCNGKRMPCARWPKPDPEDLLTKGFAFTEGPAGEHPATMFRYKTGTFRRHWAKPQEVRVRAFMGHGWYMKDLPIKSIDENARVITLAYDAWNPDLYPWYSPCVFTGENRFYIENALEELDLPGEWCLHGDDGKVYFQLPGDADKDFEVVLPRLDCLVDIHGAAWISIDGFTFTETLDGDDLHPEGVHGTNSMGLRTGPRYAGTTLRLRRAAHCRVVHNHFRDVGGNALYLEDDNERHLIAHNEFSGAGFAAVCLAGSPTQQPRFNEVADNHIHHCGVINKYIAGIFLGMSDGNRIHHNRIEYLPHHAINLSDNPFGRNYIEYNDIRWVCQEISDNGAINCWMEQPYGDTERCGHIIRFNYIADIYGLENVDGKLVRSQTYPVSGIYLDNMTSNCLVHGNVIVRVGGFGIVVHSGKNNLIENNIIAECPVGIRFQDGISFTPAFTRYSDFMTGNVFQRNICYQTKPGSIPFDFHIFRGHEDRILAFSNENVFYPGKAHTCLARWNLGQIIRNPAENKTSTAEEWRRRMGFDTDFLIADPMFVDAANGDYRLRPESPALALGFQPIPFDRIGVRGRS